MPDPRTEDGRVLSIQEPDGGRQVALHAITDGNASVVESMRPVGSGGLRVRRALISGAAIPRDSEASIRSIDLPIGRHVADLFSPVRLRTTTSAIESAQIGS